MVRAVSRGNALFFGLGGGDKEFSKLDTVHSPHKKQGLYPNIVLPVKVKPNDNFVKRQER